MRTAPGLLCFLVAALLAGCGGGDEGGDDRERIRAVIEASGTRADPADCLRHQTQNMLEQQTKMKGEAAVRVCEGAERRDIPLPTAVTVTRIEVEGDTATATAAYKGGPFSEQVPVIALVKEEGQWKEDEVVEFAAFDRDAFVLEFGRDLLDQARSSVEREVFGCMAGALDKLNQEQLEALLLDPSDDPLNNLGGFCAPRSASA